MTMEGADMMFPWGDGRRFHSYGRLCKVLFGGRMQKLAVDAGFSCPNRDGSLGNGGCSFCNNEAFNPGYCRGGKSISQQLDEGMSFHDGRYRNVKGHLAYFQAYSNTYAPLDVLRSRYEEALRHPGIDGLVIGTRPDCVDEAKLDYIAELGRKHFVMVEYGIESCHDATLERVGRGHTMACTKAAITATAERGILCGGHLILGLPGETREMMTEQCALLNSLPLKVLKFHQLQILKGTRMEEDYRSHPEQYEAFALDEYVSLLADIAERLDEEKVIERFASEVPPRCQAAPERGWRHEDGSAVRNEEIPLLVEKELERRDSWQGFFKETFLTSKKR